MQEMVTPTGLLLEVAPIEHVPCWEEKKATLFSYINIHYTFRWDINWTAIQLFVSYD